MRSSKCLRFCQRWFKTLDGFAERLLLCVIDAVRPLRRRRVPVIVQMNEVECGAACLAMVLSYFGRKTRISECRASLGSGRDGLTAQSIAQAARQHGLRVKAYSIGPEHFKDVPLPAIVHWNFNHFVVIERWSPSKVEIVDPASGRRCLAHEEFDAGFTGVVLTLEPGVQFRRREIKERPSLRRYLKYTVQVPGLGRLLLQILGVSLLLQFLGLALPVFTKVMVDQVLPFRISNLMAMLGLGMALLVLTQMVSSYLRAALLVCLEARLDTQMMLGFFEHVLSLPFSFFQQRTSGDLLMRLSSNTVLRETLTTQTVSMVLDSALVLGYLAVLLVLAPVFGLLALIIGLLQLALLLGTTRRVHALVERDLAAAAESQSYSVEALMGIATVKAAGAEQRTLDHWSNLFFKHLNVSLQRNQLSAFIDTAMSTLRSFAPLVLLWVGACQVLNGSLSLGTMLALNALALSFLSPLTSLVSSGRGLQLVRAHLERIADVVETEPEQDLQTVQNAPPLTGRIELKNVSFQYAPDAPYVLRDVSVRIEPGQKVALVGRTGSGKSTLAKLLLGLYLPTRGEILYDGTALQQLNYSSVRSQWGVVLQESFLFSGSIRQNIAFNSPDVSLDQVMAAARLAGIHDEILQMPMGYETRLDEGGSGLSGGQRQRLSLARALLREPVLLLLDEATSHLDVVTEAAVETNLCALSSTRIVVAHRLSTIQNADLILVLEQGAIVERGSHRQLLAQGGYYARLVSTQLDTQKPQSTILEAV